MQNLVVIKQIIRGYKRGGSPGIFHEWRGWLLVKSKIFSLIFKVKTLDVLRCVCKNPPRILIKSFSIFITKKILKTEMINRVAFFNLPSITP